MNQRRLLQALHETPRCNARTRAARRANALPFAAESAAASMAALALAPRKVVRMATTRTGTGLRRRSRSVGGSGTSCGPLASWRQYDDLENGQPRCRQF
jgi:hypothetical protein